MAFINAEVHSFYTHFIESFYKWVLNLSLSLSLSPASGTSIILMLPFLKDFDNSHRIFSLFFFRILILPPLLTVLFLDFYL